MTWLHLIRSLMIMIGIILLAKTTQTFGEERFLEEPQDDLVSKGQVHIVRCVLANRKGTVQWLRDGFGLGPGPMFEGYPRYRVLENNARGEYHLMISDIQLEDDAYFECQVGATETSLGLKSRRAKLIVQLPSDEIVISNGSITEVIADIEQAITCHAYNGKPSPTMTWQINGREVPPDDVRFNISQTDSVETDGNREHAVSRLSFVPDKADQGDRVICSAINAAMIEAISTSVTVEVLYKPDVSITLSTPKHVKEYDSLTFTCSATGNPNIISYKWFQDDKEMQGQFSNVLYFSKVSQEQHNQKVSCEASNRVGKTRQSHSMHVQYGPRFLSEPDDPGADIGDSITLSCAVDGNPSPAIVWRKRGSPRILSSQSTLSIVSVAEEHLSPNAVFVCTATAQGYDEIQRELHILRKGAPEISSPVEQFARYGDTGSVECVVEGLPRPTSIAWRKDGHILDVKHLRRYDILTEDLPHGRRSTIRIQSVQDQDFATYNCTAVNEYGIASREIKFAKKELIMLIFILLGVLAGVLIIVAVIIALVLYHRRKTKSISSEMNSSISDNSIRKMSHQPNLKIEYSAADCVDNWQQDPLMDHGYPPRSSPQYYDELLAANTRDPTIPRYSTYNPERFNTYGSYKPPDPYNPYNISPVKVDNVYGTYPRRAAGETNPHFDPNMENVYGSNNYGTYRRQPRYGYHQPAEFLPPPPSDPIPYYNQYLPPPSPTDSRYSTNV